MALSARQIALFGQVRVDISNIEQQPNKKLTPYTTLLELYNAGWWVTERFGTLITIVKEKAWEKDGFACLQRRIITSINYDSLDEEIKKIADRKYEKYKERLIEKQRYKKLRVKLNEDNMSTLPSGNRN